MNLEKSDEKFTSTFDYAQTPDWFTNYGVTEKKRLALKINTVALKSLKPHRQKLIFVR